MTDRNTFATSGGSPQTPESIPSPVLLRADSTNHCCSSSASSSPYGHGAAGGRISPRKLRTDISIRATPRTQAETCKFEFRVFSTWSPRRCSLVFYVLKKLICQSTTSRDPCTKPPRNCREAAIFRDFSNGSLEDFDPIRSACTRALCRVLKKIFAAECCNEKSEDSSGNAIIRCCRGEQSINESDFSRQRMSSNCSNKNR